MDLGAKWRAVGYKMELAVLLLGRDGERETSSAVGLKERMGHLLG